MINKIEIRNANQVIGMLKRFSSTAANRAKPEFETTLKNIQSNMASGKGSSLKSRTGALRKSFKYSMSGNNLSNMNAKAYSNSPYARIHEKGGIVRAKNAYRGLPGGPFLAVPSSQNRDSRGIQKRSQRQLFNSGAFIIPIKSPKAKYMILSNGQPMFYLVKEIKIKARLGFESTAKQEVPTLLSSLAKSISGNLG